MKADQDGYLTREIGRAMRFFLNLSCILAVSLALFIISVPQVKSEGLMIALIPILATILLFLAFLKLLRGLEQLAAEENDILLSSRIIWEYNKSWLIRTAIGKIKAFIEEEDSSKLPPRNR